MSVKVTDNTPKLHINMQRVRNLAVRFALDAADAYARPKTPYSGAVRSQGGKSLTGGGHLRNDIVKTVQGGTGKIVWGKRYAASQEKGIVNGRRVKKYTTPGTGPRFAENAMKRVDRERNIYIKRAASIL
jgi:hypothetical protein